MTLWVIFLDFLFTLLLGLVYPLAVTANVYSPLNFTLNNMSEYFITLLYMHLSVYVSM